MKTGYSFGSLVSFVEVLNATAVKITGDQTIAGLKTFSSNPITSAAQGSGGGYLTRKDYVDGALALKAPLASPALTGIPTAPTAAVNTDTTQLATTAFVQNALATLVPVEASSATPLMNGAATAGTSNKYSRGDHVHPTDTTKFDKAGGTITGATTMNSTLSVTGKLLGAAEIQSSNADSFRIAYGDYGAFWRNDGGNYYLMFTKSGDKWGNYGTLRPFYVNFATGKVYMSAGVSVAGGLNVDTAAVSGNLTAPTTPQGTNDTRVATTAFVNSAIVAVRSDVAPLMNGVAAIGASTQFSREDHVHPADTSKLGLGTATPLMDGTATVGTSTLGARQDHKHPTDTSRAPLASPALTGNPTAPTPESSSNGTAIATTAFVKNQISPVMPVGAVIYSAASWAPAGFLVCDGSALSRTSFASLFAVIGTTYGVGNGSTTFNLPDLRGEFIRGWDKGRGVDTGRGFGTKQLDAFQGHKHLPSNPVGFTGGWGDQNSNIGKSLVETAGTVDGGYGTPRLSTETRPRNVALLPCIKY